MADFLTWLWGLLPGSSNSQVKPPKIIAFGNVLLDRTAKLQNTDLLERYQLKLGGKGELDAEILAKLTADACESGECVLNAGGAALNSVKMLKQLGRNAVFFGAVGVDDNAVKLRELLNEKNIIAELETIEDTPTGQAICLVYNDENALYACIGASTKLSTNYIRQQIQPYLEKSRILYIEGFFVPQREEVCLYIVRNYVQEKRQLAINLSGVYIVKENFETILKLAHSAYFLFGNENEFDALKEHMECKTIIDLAEVLIKSDKPKIMLITKGADGVLVIANTDNGAAEVGPTTFTTYKAKNVHNIVDPTGAGDAFVAAFFHAWLQKRSLSESVRMATETAALVCTTIGGNLPEEEENA